MGFSIAQEDIVPSHLGPEYLGFDHICWYVGNAKQASSYYITRWGFKHIAYKGPETGSPHIAGHVIKNGDVVFVFISPIISAPCDKLDHKTSKREKQQLQEIQDHLAKHGDGVKDVAFRVNADVRPIFNKAIAAGAQAVQEPTITKDDLEGVIQICTIGSYGDTTHTLVNRELYKGYFMPGFEPVFENDPIERFLPPVQFMNIDHCVGNQPWNGLDPAVRFYEDCLDFHRYWSVDDKTMCSEYSAMRSAVVASPNEVIKMPLNEPAIGLKRSQIEEFVDYYNGAGVQHIAFLTNDILEAIATLRERGVKFISVPNRYYDTLHDRLAKAGMALNEDIEALRKQNILVDFDDRGYLLQIFAKHVVDRPTVFIEVIQRNNFDGFGAGNFKALFEAFEREQALRGNL
ncbi:4-hydroxyphenylpyruvate dioxygenase [Arthroderma uncinatum]|uniref:4-hydroxyphenylpyruvate dioxygenase n=1 Tax=Arthroderma uncinatum TaxID=74035 RepID=UPI00144AFA7B|nr:4-hydroxyphenylpyruvate dioxygenase [Arthroderma uncinatum]KAF3481330.1 4-hydroxyphenylpyruvate dioxygenase [Arthroderma uncinatum]